MHYSNLKKQFDVTTAWASTHKPVKLEKYLLENAEENLH